MSLPPVLFVRHGETDWNVEGRLQGTRDVGLNAKGRTQAEAAGHRLRAALAAAGRDPADAAYVSSPLARARDTMGRLRRAMGLPEAGYTLDARLQELCFGAWEGLTWAEVKLREPARHKARRADRWGFVPPGGESYAMLAERLRGWVETVEDEVVVVSHGGVARALMVLIGGVSPGAAPETAVPQGRVLRLAEGRCAWL